MQCLRISGLVVFAGLLSACQSQREPPQEGVYVDFVMELMVESAKLSEGPSDAKPAVQAVESWRGSAEGEDGG